MKPTLARGTRDFLPDEAAQRNYIFHTIRTVFELYGFQPLETPAIENLQTLTGKYGEEGDRLIFKILNSGDFFKPLRDKQMGLDDVHKAMPELCDKALRYDLTVPFARVVAMHRDKIQMPFKRYQIQPVWRADRPQKGRYREFYQCDADVVGSHSLINEMELIKIYDEVFHRLQLPVMIQINHRKLLAGLAAIWGIQDRLSDFTIELDKLDKIGKEGVISAMREKQIGNAEVHSQLQELIDKMALEEAVLTYLDTLFTQSPLGRQGLDEVQQIRALLSDTNRLKRAKLQFNITLARGLNYYTGLIMEVKAADVQMGSIGGGGRYDDLTGIFGYPHVPGVGISFGADRIFDVLLEKNLFPLSAQAHSDVLIVNFGLAELSYCLPLVDALRQYGIKTEVYPDAAKLGKQFSYADAKKIQWVISAGSREIDQGLVVIKNMHKGEQQEVAMAHAADYLRQHIIKSSIQ